MYYQSVDNNSFLRKNIPKYWGSKINKWYNNGILGK